MKPISFIALLLLLVGAEFRAGAAEAHVEPVVEAERAFARAAREQGVAAAFRAFIADDGLLFVPDPVPGKKILETAPDKPGTLVWWPTYAGIAASGDLGFTSGPFHADRGGSKSQGYFFTVWRKQKGGNWRWVLDHGTPTDFAAPAAPTDKVVVLRHRHSLYPSRRSKTAWDAVLRAEIELARGLLSDAPRAYRAMLAPDGRVMRVGPQPAVGRADCITALSAGPARIETEHLGGDVSAAGDLAYTYGHARWDERGGRTRGHYVRIWQRRSPGWRLIVDEIVPVPARPPGQ